MRFSSFNIAIHGIRPEDVADQPEFPDVMAEFFEDFHGGDDRAQRLLRLFRLAASLDFYGSPIGTLLLLQRQARLRHWPTCRLIG